MKCIVHNFNSLYVCEIYEYHFEVLLSLIVYIWMHRLKITLNFHCHVFSFSSPDLRTWQFLINICLQFWHLSTCLSVNIFLFHFWNNLADIHQIRHKTSVQFFFHKDATLSGLEESYIRNNIYSIQSLINFVYRLYS